MAGTGQGYDLSVTTYSPDGRIFQTDYAQKCCDNAPTCLALVCKDGILLATQKLLQYKLLVHGTNKRCYAVTKQSGAVATGLITDCRVVVNRVREEANSYKRNFGEAIPGYLLAERVGLYMHAYTLYYSVRPIGTAILIANYSDEEGGTLFSVDPSGLVQKWAARALGKGRQLANTELEKLNLETLTCKEALYHASRILHKCHDESKKIELEMNWICKDSGYQHEIVPRALVGEAEEKAKKALEEEDDD